MSEKRPVQSCQPPCQREDVLQALLELAPCGYWDWHIPSDTFRISPSFKRMCGYEKDELPDSRESWRELIFAQDLADLDRIRERHAAQGDPTPCRHETRCRRKDGSVLWTLCSGRIVEWAEDGTPVRMLGAHLDITAQKEAERILCKLQQRTEDFHADVRAFHWEVDRDGRYTFLCSAVERVLGYRPEELCNRLHFYDLCPAEDREELRRYGLESIRQGVEQLNMENRMVTKDGRTLWVMTNGTVLRDDTGAAIGFRGMDIDISERKAMEAALAESELRNRSMLAAVPDMIFVSDGDGRYLDFHAPPGSPLLAPPEKLIGSSIREWFPAELADRLLAVIRETLRSRAAGHIEYSLDFPAEPRHFEARLTAMDDRRILASVRDITRHKEAEAQWMQAQKMESIGRLAGGVAHDFNNMLQIILGCTEMALELTEPQSEISAELREIESAAKRSADLTRQLLGFARKKDYAPVALDLNAKIASSLDMLKRMVGHDIVVRWEPDPRLGAVQMDPTQLDQILANLCVNARDAMKTGGEIAISTGHTNLTAFERDHFPEAEPGRYALLTFRDNGDGMDRATLDRIFEPFFTTKPIGQGTGLGLPTVYSVVKQHKGHIAVDSRLGRGTVFRLLFPICTDEAEKSVAPPAVAAPIRAVGNETILVMEDEESVLTYAVRILKHLGYNALGTVQPQEALRLAREHEGTIALLLTDVMMPVVGGRELARQLCAWQPQMRILYMSGYSRPELVERKMIEADAHYIQKPFSMQMIGLQVRKTLTAPVRCG